MENPTSNGVIDVALRDWRRALRDAVELPIATRGVALVLGEFMTSETGDGAFPSHELLQQSCGLGRSQTKHHVAVLIRAGYLRKTRAGQAGQTAEHRACVPATRWVGGALVRAEWSRATKRLTIPWRDQSPRGGGRNTGHHGAEIPATEGSEYRPPTPRSTPRSTPTRNTDLAGSVGALPQAEATRRRYMRMTDDEFDRALWSPPLDDDQDLDRINWMAARGARRGALVGVLVAALAKAGALDNSGTAAHESIRVTTK